MHNYYININNDKKIANVINNNSKLEIESKNKKKFRKREKKFDFFIEMNSQ